MLVCNYLTLKSETRVVSLMQILDVFLLKCKVQMVVVQHSVNETVLQIYILQKKMKTNRLLLDGSTWRLVEDICSICCN